MSSQKRILAVDDDVIFLNLLHDELTAAGMAFSGISEPTRAVPTAMSSGPDLILLDRNMPVLSGAEVIRSLRAFPKTASIPVAFVSANATERELLRALRSGAVDLLAKPFTDELVDRIRALLDDLSSSRRPPEGASADQALVTNFLGMYRRARRSGFLQVNPETPFEGRAQFRDGELVQAEYGPLRGEEALGEMLQIEDGVWHFNEGVVAPPPRRFSFERRSSPPASGSKPPLPPPEGRPRLLVVDDDPDLRVLFRAQLGKAGFEVDVASDGIQGVEVASSKPFDLVIADLNMPRMDGWGMLKALKENYRTRELPVVFLSAHDDYRETLKAARAGAHDYLPKTGWAEGVAQRVRALVAPRLLALKELEQGHALSVSANLLGLQWLMRALAQLALTGELEMRDEWGEYRVIMRDGTPLDASARWPKRQASGLPAVAALLVSRGAEGYWRPGPVDAEPRLNMPLEQLLNRTCEMLNQLESRVTASRLAATTHFQVDEPLYELYRKIGTDRGLLLAQAICEQKMKPSDVSAALSIPPGEVLDGLKELLRRGVISFPDAP